MKRDLRRLTDTSFDLLVVGGGISGAIVAWDAVLRGLSVALLEKADFGAATSSASSKLIHGGVRYLQQGQLHKTRESLLERRAFLRMTPHLLRRVPFLIPTYSGLLRGRPLLAAGMGVYELLGLDADAGLPAGRCIPRFRLLDREGLLAREPAVPSSGLTGGILYDECQMESSERTTLAFVASAAARGAEVANYVAVDELLRDGDRVCGARAQDLLSGEKLEVRARMVANVTGPWALRLIESMVHGRRAPELSYAKGCHIVTRPLTRGHALALATGMQNEALINRGGRHVFLIPWRGHTLVGTTNTPHRGRPDDVRVLESDVALLLEELRSALGGAAPSRDDVLHAYAGLYPLIDTRVRESVYQGSGRYRLYDHGRRDGVEGLVTAIGAKFTTARRVAERCVDLVFLKLGRTPPPCTTASTPVAGGELEEVDEALRGAAGEPAPRSEESLREPRIDAESLRELVCHHGARYRELLALAAQDAALAERVSPERHTLRAAVVFAAREEMAMKLGDVVFRRTGLGTLGHPGRPCLEDCASILASQYGWTPSRVRAEIEEVEQGLRWPH